MNPYREDTTEKRFYLGTNCYVVCLNQASGEIIWKTQFQSRMSGTIVTLLLHGARVFAGCSSRVACLDAANGEIIWKTDLPKLNEPVALALDVSLPGGQLIAGGGGHVFALSAASGGLLWHNELSGLGFSPVCLRVPGAMTAQVLPRYVQSGETTRIDPLEDEQSGEGE